MLGNVQQGDKLFGVASYVDRRTEVEYTSVYAGEHSRCGDSKALVFTFSLKHLIALLFLITTMLVFLGLGLARGFADYDNLWPWKPSLAYSTARMEEGNRRGEDLHQRQTIHSVSQRREHQ